MIRGFRIVNRMTVLVGLLVVGSLSMAAAGVQSRGEPARNINVEKLTDRLYVLGGAYNADALSPYCPPGCRDGGGNTAVFLTAAGPVVIDTKNPGWGRPILEKIRTITDKPVVAIINTHTHADHTGGNLEFPASVDLIAHENTKVNMEEMDIFKGEGARSLPKKVFKDRMTLFSGADRIDLYYFGRGHTNGDAFVVFPSERAMHAGDMFAHYDAMVVYPTGSTLEFPDTLAKAIANIPNVDRVITGHQEVVPWRSFVEFQHFNRDLLQWTKEARAAGRNVDAAALLVHQRLFLSNDYRDIRSEGYRVKNAVQLIYSELGESQAAR